MREQYLETTNDEDFDFEMVWSCIGGYIGIFLGYSLAQLPEVIVEAYQAAINR